MKHKGFTLIELLVVIIIIGVLSVTAAPKFINLESNAHDATLKALQANVNTATALVHAKSVLKQSHKDATGTINFNSTTVDTVYGYPKAPGAADSPNTQTYWDTLLTIPTNDFVFTKSVAGDILFYSANSTAPTDKTDPCLVYFTEATSSAPAITGRTDCL